MTFKKGQSAWNKGKPHDTETRRKISNARKGQQSYFKGMTKKSNPDKVTWGVSGENNYGWAGGTNVYRKIAFEYYEPKCARCRYNYDMRGLLVHHKDRNRSNSKVENLEILCRSCHFIEHLNDRFHRDKSGKLRKKEVV